MPRRTVLAAFLFWFTTSVSFAQTPKDRVYFRDPSANKVIDLEGDVVETLSGIRFIGGDKKERVISATDLVRIEYGTLDPVLKQAAAPQENDPDPAKPLAYFSSKLKDLPANATDKTRRFLLFRDAYWTAKVADARTSPDEFKTEGKRAVDKIVAFIKANKKSWEQWQLGRTAARICYETDDWKTADDILKDLAGVADATPELKADIAVLRVGYLIRAKNYAAAKELLAEVERDATIPTGSPRERLAIYKEALAALPPKDPESRSKPTAVAKIEELISKTKDTAVRATGYNMLGEVYLAHRMPRDAMWSYLWVDTVYNSDKDENVWAVRRLIELFAESGEKEGEKSRADQFRERLPKVR
jgi:hypothetical protein